MPKPVKLRESKERLGLAPQGVPAGRRDTLLIVWLGLAVYLVLFYGSALDSAAPSVLRRWQLLLSRIDPQVVANWLDGLSWRSLAERATILAQAAAIFLPATAAGWICLRLLGVDRRLTRLEVFGFAAGMGLNLVSLMTLALGLGGMLGRDVFAGAAAVILVWAGLLYGRQQRGATSETLAPVDEPPRLGRGWLWAAVPFTVVIVLAAMLPPVDFDVREYHLQAPKEFYQAGRITFLPHNVYANMPLGTEMLSLLGMIVAGDWWRGALVGKTLIALFAPLTALVLLAAGRRLATQTAGTVAALVYISIPWVALVSTQGLVEGAFAFYLCAALVCVLTWQQPDNARKRDIRLLALAGFLAGGAVSCKYPAVVFCVLPLAAWVAVQSVRATRATDTPRPALLASLATSLGVFMLAVALGCGLWLAKNAVFTGNPVYPLLDEVFGGTTLAFENRLHWAKAHNPPNFQVTDFLARTLGFTLTSDWLSPLVIPLAALAVLAAKGRRLALGLAGYVGLVFLAWWLLTHRIDRFWVPILPVAALLAGIGATWSASRAWRVTLVGLLGLGLLANFTIIASGTIGDGRYLADLDMLRADSTRVDPWHFYLNEHAFEVTKVLLVGDAQPFDLEVPVIYNTVFDACLLEKLAGFRTPEQVHQALTDRGVSHIYVAWGEVDRYRSPGNYGITDFIQPEVFDTLVAAGVLAPLAPLDKDPGRVYRVTPLR